MSRSGDPAATLRPGVVRAIFDHLVVSLTPDGRPGPPCFVYSHYRFRWSADGIVGDLVFLETLGVDGPDRRLITDRSALADRWARLLAPGAWPSAEPLPTAGPGTVAVSPIGDGTARETLTAEGLAIDVEVAELAPPILASGPAPRVPGSDIVSVLIEAGTARASLDGRPVAGRPFENEGWVAWLGRPMRSAVLALGEVLVDRD